MVVVVVDVAVVVAAVAAVVAVAVQPRKNGAGWIAETKRNDTRY